MRAPREVGSDSEGKVVSLTERAPHEDPMYRPADDDSAIDAAPSATGNEPGAGFLDTVGHFYQWFVLLVAFAAVVVGMKWLTQRTMEAPPPVVIDKSAPAVSIPSAEADGPDAQETARLGEEPLGEAGRAPTGAADGSSSPNPASSGGTDVPASSGVSGGEPTVLITSTPPGARLVVDDGSSATTPIRLPLRPGSHLQLDADGFETLHVRYGADDDALHLTLTPRPSSYARVRAPAQVPYPPKTRHVEPAWPEPGRRTGTLGIVILTLEIDAQGNVVQVEPLRGVSPAVDQAAIDAAWRWKFQPTLREGRPVHVIGNFSVPFTRER